MSYNIKTPRGSHCGGVEGCPLKRLDADRESCEQDAHLAEKKLMLRIPHQTACQGRHKCMVGAHFVPIENIVKHKKIKVTYFL